MKKLFALFLAFLYLSFIAGAAVTVQHPDDYSCANFLDAGIYNDNNYDKDSRNAGCNTHITSVNSFNASKHIPAVGKITVPGSNAFSAWSNFVLLSNETFYLQNITVLTPSFYMQHIFLRNRVLKI